MKNENGEPEKGYHPDQRAYLDHITSLYGYGVPDPEDAEKQSTN